MVVEPVASGSQPFSRDSSRKTECWPEHMWRIGLGLLAVASEPGRGQRVERHALGAGRDQRLADAGPAVHRLERPDVEVLAGVRAGHERELGRLEVEGLDPAGLDQRDDAERLDADCAGSTMRSGSPRPRIRPPSTSTSTMSPRWTLSSIPPRIWRTRIGAGRRAAVRPTVDRVPDGTRADVAPRPAAMGADGRSLVVVTVPRGYCGASPSARATAS